jgi:hypothetical protein
MAFVPGFQEPLGPTIYPGNEDGSDGTVCQWQSVCRGVRSSERPGQWDQGVVEYIHDYHGKQRLGSRVSVDSDWQRQEEMLRADRGSSVCYRDWEGASNWLHNDRPVNSSYIFDYEYGEPDGLRPKEYV